MNTGKGKKTCYGMDADKLAAIRSQIEDSGAESRVNLRALYDNIERYLKHAADLARSDKKDAARNWVRFFTMSRALHVLADGGFDVSKLQKQLNEVSLACHPLDVPEFETDIQAIRFYLQEILSRLPVTEAGQGVPLLPYPTLPDSFPQ